MNKCYWEVFGLCNFDPDEVEECHSEKPCMRYVREDLVDDYLRGIIDYNNFLEKTLQEYEDGIR